MTAMNVYKRDTSIDGLKGVALLIVLLHHFILSFYPSVIGGVPQQINTKMGWELFIYKTPLSIFFNGYFAVSLFFLITGYILTKKTCKNNNGGEYVVQSIYRRVFRLMPLVIIVLFFGYIIMKLRLTFNIPVNEYTKSNWLATFFPIKTVSITTMIIDIFTRIPFGTSVEYYNVLWIIPYELFGSWFVYAASSLLSESKLKYHIYILFAFAFFNTPYISFLLGMILAENEKWVVINKYVFFLCFVISLICGSSMIDHIPFQSFLKSLSAALFFLSCIKIDSLNKIIRLTFFSFLGRNSYYYYLTHMLALITLSSYAFISLIPYTRYYQAVSVAFVLYIGGTMLYSFFLKKIEYLYLQKS